MKNEKTKLYAYTATLNDIKNMTYLSGRFCRNVEIIFGFILVQKQKR